MWMGSLGGYFCPSRFSFSGTNMLSFSLDPEIVSFLWINSQPPTPSEFDLALRYRIAHPSRLFQIFVSSDPSAEETTLFSTLQCTVVTTGILVVVGISSLYTFKVLQWLRQSLDDSSLLQNVKSLIVNLSKPFVRLWRKSVERDGISTTATVTRNNNGPDNGNQPFCKRPSDLQILPKNGSPIINASRLFRSSRDNSLERRLLTKDRTPLADCDIASGEEDISDIQGQYFGPTVRSSILCMELTGSSPEESPIHALSPSKQQVLRSSPKKARRVDDDDRECEESSC